jgi:DNA-binding NarL/FixJ family response regulator
MSPDYTAAVLVADRHHGLFEGIRGLLQTTFGRVFFVTDKTALIDRVGRLQPTVIIMDLSFASGNLPDLVREIRRLAPAVRLVLLSVHNEPTVIAYANAAGADGLVVKRAIATDLMPAIEGVLAGQRHFPAID